MATSTFTIIYFFLLPSFHSLWIIVKFIIYIDNKRNSIVIHLLVVISIVGGRGGFIFSYCHNYNKGRFGFFFSCCQKYSRWWDLFAFFLMVQWWRGTTILWQRMIFWHSWACLFAVQAAYPKAYKRIATNWVGIIVSIK